MLSIIKKILILNMLIIMGVILPSRAFAQWGIESQSYDEFVEAHNIGGLNDLDDEVFCGNQTTKCNRKTQICIRCSTYTSTGLRGLGSKAYVETGKCVPYNSTNRPESFSSEELHRLAGDFCRREIDTTSTTFGKITSTLFGGAKVRISYEKNGFIAEKSLKILFNKINLTKEPFCEYQGGQKTEVCYRLVYDSDNNTSLAYSTSGKEGKNIAKGCEVLPIKINNMQKCFFCPLAKVIFDTANSVTQISFDNFSQSFMRLMIIAFAVWLALSSLKIVFTYTKQDGNKYLSGIIVQAGKFLFAYLLLMYHSDLFNLFIKPILHGGVDMGKAILPGDININIVSTGVDDDYFGENSLYPKIEAFLTVVQGELAAMQAIGSSLFCVGGHRMLGWGWPGEILDNIAYGLQMMGLGLILFIFAFILTISFAFYFLDALLQLAILGAMLPLMIAGWPFKITANYSKSGLGMLLNTFFMLFFTAFVVAVELKLVDTAISESNDNGGLTGLFTAINTQDTDQIQNLVSIGGAGFLLLTFAGIFGFKFVKETPKIANKLAGGLNFGIAPKIGTMAASAATGAAKKVTKPIREAAAEKYHERGGLMGGAGRFLQLPAKGARWVRQSALGKAVGNTALGRTLTKVRTSVQGFGSNIGQKIESFGDNMVNKGNAGIHTDKVGGILSGAGQKFIGKIAQKFGGGIDHVSQEGLLNATGQKIENFSKKIHKEFRDAEKRAEKYERDAAKFEAKYGRPPKKGEI